MRLIDPHHSRAVFVATASYSRDDDLPDLPQVRDGAVALRDMLTRPELGGFLEQHCRLIIDPHDPSVLAEQLHQFADEATDTLLIYYAGHGLLGPGETLHFGCTGSTRELPHLRSLPIDWVHHALRRSPAANRLLIVDSCFSGQALRGIIMANPAKVAASKLDIDDIGGRWTLVSSAERAPSYILDGAHFSGFTGALLEVLNNGISYRSPLLALDDIFSGIRTRMRRQGLPLPQVLNTDTAARLALVRNVAYDPEAPDTAEDRLGSWWDGVTVRHGRPEAGPVNNWITRKRQDGGFAVRYFTPSATLFTPYWKPSLWVYWAGWHKGLRFGSIDEASEALIKMVTCDLPFVVYILGTCTQAMEPAVANVLEILVADEPEIAVVLLRGLLAEFPGKCIRLCREIGLSLPLPQWWLEQKIEPPEPPPPS